MNKIEIFREGTIDSHLIRTFLDESILAFSDEIGDVDLQNWPSKLATHATAYCTRRADGTLLAALFAYLNPETHIGYIPFICVLPECEKGAAYRFHELYRQTAIQCGITTLQLEVLTTNTHAISFYTRQGYAVLESRPDRNRYLMGLSI